MTLIHDPWGRGYIVCVQYHHLDGPGPLLPVYHGPRVRVAADGGAHPFFPGTVHYTGARYPVRAVASGGQQQEAPDGR